MKKIFCLNAISKFGTDMLTEDYQLVDDEGCGRRAGEKRRHA